MQWDTFWMTWDRGERRGKRTMAVVVALGLARLGVAAEPVPVRVAFPGQDFTAVISPGTEQLWGPREPAIRVGVIPLGEERELFLAFTALKLEQKKKHNLQSSFNAAGFRILAPEDCEGRVFEGKLTYQAQPQTFQGRRGWVKNGAAITRESRVTVVVPLRKPPKLVIAAGSAVEWVPGGKSRVSSVSQLSKSLAEARVTEQGRVSIQARKPGKTSFKLKYLVGPTTLELEAEVLVADEEVALPLTLEKGWSERATPEGLTTHDGWKLVELVGSSDPSVLEGLANKGELKVTGKAEGSAALTAVYTARRTGDLTGKPRTVKVRFDCTVKEP
jgi:hypothetical protein